MLKLDFVEYLLKVEEICKVGLKYSKDPYALDNYESLQKLTKKFIEKVDDVHFEYDNFFKRDVYPTPNVSVRAIILNEDKTKVLLVQEKLDLGYSFPGGWSEIGLTPVESIKKEVREEAGCECEIVRIVGVTDRYKNLKMTSTPEYILTYLVKPISKFSESCYEIVSKDFFDVHNLPKISNKNNKEQMERLIDAAINDYVILD